jgi:L-seryl-tRNA(Ser) seleniumtransferase
LPRFSSAGSLSSALEQLPYVRGEILHSTADDVAKLHAAWRIVERRRYEGALFNFSGLERSLDVDARELENMDDDLAPALYGDRLIQIGLEHLGGQPGRDDVFVANRLTAATVAAMQVLVEPGMRVVGVSPTYTHPAVARAVRLAGGELDDGGPIPAADLVVITRLAVTYDSLPIDALRAAIEAARERGVRIFVDDAGGARVGPAIFGQPKTLELGVDVGATGLDKYGTSGPRLGLLGGRADLVGRIRARAIELGLEARPMLYPAVVRSLERYRPERVRELVAATSEIGDALEERLHGVVSRTPVAVKLEGEAILAEALRRTGDQVTSCHLVPYEATAALAMLLLRDHGVLTVHFAALPPGTSALLLKFVPPETLRAFGGAERLAVAVDEALDALAAIVGDERAVAELLGV